LPEVSNVGGASYLPLSGYGGGLEFAIEGQETKVGQKPSSDLQFATPGYFETLRIPVLSGRTFNNGDTATSPEVAMINRTFARKFFANGDPIGRRLNAGDDLKPEWLQIVGVVGDVRENGLDVDVQPEVYLSTVQSPPSFLGFTLRTKVPPYAAMSSVRQVVWGIDKDQPIARSLSMEDAAKESLAIRKITTSLMTLFAGISMALACIGIYGVISYNVAQRTHEFGIRMALGATRQNLALLVLNLALKLGALGIVVGLVGSFVLSRFAAALVYGISTRDAFTYSVAPVLLGTVALVASLVPALRASRLDPIVALRQE
jgi:putative ABC transport system permease protein